jgi:hypothetical protein
MKGVHDKKTQIILSVCAVLIILGAAIAVPILTTSKHDDAYTQTEFKKLAQSEFLNDVDPFTEIYFVSEVPMDTTIPFVSIKDQNGHVPNCTMVKISDTEYVLKPPGGGYGAGDTYKIKLLSDDVFFKDGSYSDRRDMTFSVFKNDVFRVSQKSDVKNVQTDKVYSPIDDEKIIMEQATIDANGIKANDLIILPVYDEYGFVTQAAYKVVSIDGSVMTVEKPSYDEIFDELEIKGTFDAVYSKEYIHLYDESEFLESLMEEKFIRGLRKVSESKDIPEVKLSVMFKDGKVITEYSVVFKKFFKGLDFTIKGKAEFRLSARADIDVLNGTFNVGGIISFTNEYKFILGYEHKFTGDDGLPLREDFTKELAEILNEEIGANEMGLRFFSLYVPTPIVLLGFSFDVKLTLKVELKIELGITIRDEFKLEVGAKRDCDGMGSYFNKEAKRTVDEIEFRGTLEVKLGFEIKFAASAARVLETGVKFQIGIYGKIAGFAKAKTLMALTLDNYGSEPDHETFCYGAYFEAGIFSDISLFASVDLLIIKYEVKVTLLEVKLPLFSVGYTQRIEIIPNEGSIILDVQGKTALPSVTIRTIDMFTGKITEKTIEREDLEEFFNISTGSIDFLIDNDNYVHIRNLSAQEFKGTVSLKLRPLQSFASNVKVSLGFDSGTLSVTGSRAVYHYELGALNVSTSITVSKQPVAPDSLSLEYQRITNDSEYAVLHKELSSKELQYNFRDDINGIKDFQIGRLVNVVPIFGPSNVSYRTLDYIVESGEQYIVGGASGITTYNVDGVTYAMFRIIDDVSAIGNINGSIDPLKEIKISAVTNGYKGEYAGFNIHSSPSDGIFASAIPVLKYDLTPVVDGTSVPQTSVRPGAEIQFEINAGSVFPSNGTRGLIAQENIQLISGPAVKTGSGTILVDSDATVGSQIVILSTLSGIERQYFLNIVKNAVETITISSDVCEILPGGSADIAALITGSGGEASTVDEASFFIIAGNNYATLTQDPFDKNKVTLNLEQKAPAGTLVKVMSIIDGQRSNVLEFEVGKIDVTSVTLSADGPQTVPKGGAIQLSAAVSPLHATNGIVSYWIVEGGEYAAIDSVSGKLTFRNSCIGGETVKVIAVADGVQSNELIFTVAITEVKYVQFPRSSAVVRDGQSIELDAFVNPDSTVTGIIYSIVSGASYGTISGDTLIINPGLSTNNKIVVRASAAGNPAIYYEKTFFIYADMESISIDGDYDSVYMWEGESKTATVTDTTGTVISNNLVNFTVTDAIGGSTRLASVDPDGVIKIMNFISESVTELQIILKAEYNGLKNQIFINIIIPPQFVDVVDASDMTATSAVMKPNETIELAVKVSKADNAKNFNHIELVTEGKIDASISTELIGYGMKSYSIFVKVSPDAMTGETATVRVIYWVYDKQMISHQFKVTVGKVTETVEITNIPQSMNIGESITLNCEGYPENRNYTPKFRFADSVYRNYASLDPVTGELTIENGEWLAGYSVKVEAILDGIVSRTYTILITEEVRDVTIDSGASSKGVQYIDEYGFYILYPGGEFVIDAHVTGGGKNPVLHYALDKIGQEYLNISGNVLTVKDTAINSGINATVAVYSDNGIVSNTLTIYIPTVIRTVQDWYSINDNISGYYVLANDLDLAGEVYEPIVRFGGIIDGAGHSIRNLTVTELNKNNCFGLIQENYGMILNLSVKQFSMRVESSDGTAYIGVVAAKNYGYIIGCTVFSTDEKVMFAQFSDSYAGAICGLNAGTIRLTVSQLIIESFGHAGGIAGMNTEEGSIISCMNTQQIVVLKYDSEKAVLGLVGFNDGSVTDSYNYGKVFDREKWAYVVG